MTTREKFLEELKELTRKYQLVIGGCGCCGSPWVEFLPDDELDGFYTGGENGDELRWETEA